MSRSPLVAFVLLTAALNAQPALQPAWSERSPWPAERESHSIAYDTARERLLLFGGNGFGIFQQFRDTWEWNGACWLQASSPIRPSTRSSAGMAYDQTRRRMVLFGGADACNSGNNETWEFDGSVWAQRFPAHAPPPRTNEALTYDVLRQRVVLFGGIVEPGKTCLADTWEWDGSDWVQRLPATSPAARYYHAMTYDAARGRVLMFGGACNRGPLFGDTWEWDGTNWTQRAPTVAPAPRAGHGLAYDAGRRRTVLHGGWNNRDETWEWDGNTWTQRLPTTKPSGSWPMAYDTNRQRVVLVAGTEPGTRPSVWEWDGNNWSEQAPPPRPVQLSGTAMASDSARQRVVLFGGRVAFDREGGVSNGTWEWDGGRWLLRRPANQPWGRSGHAMAYHAASGRVVLFGGAASNDTWEWDGNNWLQRTPANSPSPRFGHAMAYDALRSRVVLFGGASSNDTWEWDGNNWLRMTPALSPPARDSHALAYDAAHGQVVLFGGYGSTLYDDTWTWDGTTWRQQNPLHRPPSRTGHAMTYDEVHGEVLLVGGEDASGVLADAWSWNGASWQAARTPFARNRHAITFDAARRQVVLFGSHDGSGLADSMWVYRDTGAFEHYGNACNPNGRPPVLSTFGDAGLSAACFGFDVAAAPPGAPVLLLLSINMSAIPIGACRLLVDPSLIVTVGGTANDYGSAMMPIPVPGDRRMVGGAVFAQVIALDTPANQLVFTDGVRFRVGD